MVKKRFRITELCSSGFATVVVLNFSECTVAKQGTALMALFIIITTIVIIVIREKKKKSKKTKTKKQNKKKKKKKKKKKTTNKQTRNVFVKHSAPNYMLVPPYKIPNLKKGIPLTTLL